MPWWSWVLIWSGLALALVAMIVWCALRLFGKLMKASDALAELGDRVADAFAGADPFADPFADRIREGENSLPKIPAIFQDAHELSVLRARSRADTARRRQERRDERVRRGKLLSHTPSN
ncbi:hypothetical protein GCM10027056_23500 [Glaciibacter psychrotolerans]